jgi:hypothetical protein
VEPAGKKAGIPVPLRVLILEDQADDAELILRELRRAGFEPVWKRADSEAGFLTLLEEPFEVILADYNMPGFDALRALHVLRERDIDIPSIVVTGSVTEEMAVECIRRGAADYLLKDRLARLAPAVKFAMEQKKLRDEKRRAEKALRESEQRFRRLAENAPDIIYRYRVHPERGFEYVSPAATGITGHTPDEFYADPDLALKLVHPDDRGRLEGFPRAGEGLTQPVVVRVRRKDGSIVWVEQRNVAVHDESGALIAIEGIARDITERKRAEEEIQRQREALLQHEKLAAMGSLLAGVAHEMNNPLSIVMCQTALLGQKMEDPGLVEGFERITQGAERCARIVRNFLALARQRPPERERVALNQVVEEAVELLSYPLGVDGVDVVVALDPDLPLLWADPHQLHQVVVNLVSNAHQAMRQGSAPRRITLSTRAEPARGRVSLRVADSGPGIPPEIRSRIFEPFFTTKPPGEGTGLGLSLCHGIVDSHGGAITVESQPGQGAVFAIELPVEAPTRAEPTAPTAEEQSPVAAKAILIVDDEPVVGMVLADLLSGDGHRPDTAANGAVALEKLQADSYDLVLSDLRMPVLDGPGLYREIERRHPEMVRRFVFMTGDTLSAGTREFLERTGAPSLNKPFSLDEVRRVIQRTLSAA